MTKAKKSNELLNRGHIYLERYYNRFHISTINKNVSLNNQTTLIAFCDQIVQHYTFQKENDPVLKLFQRLQYISLAQLNRFEKEADDVERTRKVIVHILREDQPYFTLLLLLALEVVAPELSLQAAKHLRSVNGEDESSYLIQFDCHFCQMLTVFGEKLRDQILESKYQRIT